MGSGTYFQETSGAKNLTKQLLAHKIKS